MGTGWVAGARRLRATRVEGIVRVPAVVRDLSDRQSVAGACGEQRRREDLKAIDEARSLVCLIEEFNVTHEDAADTLGRSRAVMSSTLRLRNLHSTVQRPVVERRPEMGHARAPLAFEPGRSRGGRLTGSWRTTTCAPRDRTRCARDGRTRISAGAVAGIERSPGAGAVAQSKWLSCRPPRARMCGSPRVCEQELDALLAWLRQRDAVAESGNP